MPWEGIIFVFVEAAKVNDRFEQLNGDRDEGLPRVLRDEDLVARAQEDDRWAQDELVRRYHEKAFAIAYHMAAGDMEEARDFTQEAFLRVFKNIKKFRGLSSFYTWFYRILINACADGRRRRQKWRRIFSFRRGNQEETGHRKEEIEEREPGEDDDNPLSALRGKELGREVQRVLMTLSEKQRATFILKVSHGMSIHEIGQVMGMAEGTVKSHLFRATRSLREALKDWA